MKRKYLIKVFREVSTENNYLDGGRNNCHRKMKNMNKKSWKALMETNKKMLIKIIIFLLKI